VLPSTIQGECTDFVDKYSKQIINLIVNELANPDQICQLLSLCTAELMSPFATKVHLLKSVVPGKLHSPSLYLYHAGNENSKILKIRYRFLKINSSCI